MKKSTTLVLMLTLGWSVATHAVIIASDDFSYPDGGLIGQGGITNGWSGAYTDGGADFVVTSGVMSASLDDALAGQVFRGLTTPLTTDDYPDGEIWMAFDGALELTGTWGYGGISPFEGGSDEKGIIGAVTGFDMFGITGTEDNGAVGTNRTVVMFDLNSNDISLWAGPVGSTIDVSVAALQTNNFAITGADNLRFAIHSGNMQIDNFVMGTTPADVGAIDGQPAAPINNFMISGPIAITGGQGMLLEWDTTSGQSYDLQSKSNLTSQLNWDTITNVTGTGGGITITTEVDHAETFYQVVTP